MTTLAIMRTAIASQLGDDAALTNAQIDDAIRTTIAHYARRPWWFTETKNITFATVAAQEYYTATDLADIPNIPNIEAATVTYGGIKYPLRFVNFAEMDELQTGAITGLPTTLTAYATELRLYPTPDTAYTITLAYNDKLAALSADGDSNGWTTHAEELIRQGAKKRLALDVIASDEIAMRCERLEREAFDELIAENRRRQPRKVLATDLPMTSSTYNVVTGPRITW